ncbi:beta-1,3-galactosyltransferase 1 [Salarias fasciatus]|uniref:Hexosyltransferase n=1 Tax=Salarias fasciatus TaxID=181472 RepID=A0A672G025_SALFA|nr:beta-1,3-galactosyltransferase 1-like [Salarias fasciatus]
MATRPPADHRRLWTGSCRRHGLICLMIFVVAYLFYSTKTTSKWNSEMEMKNHTNPPDRINKSQTERATFRTRNRNSNTPESNPTLHTNAAGVASVKAAFTSVKAIIASAMSSVKADTASAASGAAAGFSANASSPVVPQTHIASTAHQEAVKTQRPPPAPYVSPGPYLVEYPYEYHFIINEPERCEQEKPFLVLVVPVAPYNKADRDVIRATWGSESSVSGKAVRVFFLLGLQGDAEMQQQLLQESEAHRDLIQSDFVDCYKNLTIKTMVMLEWLDSHCPGASYAMKIDSDMFLNVKNLVNMLIWAPKYNYMTGLVARNAAVLRDPSSKWYLPFDLYPQPQYPRYALGLGYILSSDLPKKLIQASRHVKPVYIEDVFLGLCMQQLGIPPTDPPGWDYFHVFPLRYNRCSFSRIIATTTEERTDRVWLWKDFKKPGPYC